MTKSVTVNFDDGTSHTYDNVPDDVSDSQVESRAANDFSDKTITKVGGATPTPLDTGFGTNSGNLGQKTIAGFQTAINMTGEALQHPAAHLLEGYYGGKYAINKIADALASRGAAPVAPVAPQIEIPQNVGGGPRPTSNIGTAEQTFEALKQPATPPQGNPRAMGFQGEPVRPTTLTPAANAIQGAQTAQQGENWMAKAFQTLKQAAPTLQQYGGRVAQAAAPVGQALAPVGRALAPIAELAARYNPAITGIQALTHSGGLNTNEEEELRRRRAMAPTITR